MTLGYDAETDTFYCYCVDGGIALVPTNGVYKCPNCGRFLTEQEKHEHISVNGSCAENRRRQDNG